MLHRSGLSEDGMESIEDDNPALTSLWSEIESKISEVVDNVDIGTLAMSQQMPLTVPIPALDALSEPDELPLERIG
jgi:hypothetical protein